MNNHKQRFIESIKLFLRKNDLDGDTTFYEIGDWIERGEEYLKDSEFVIVSEGGLNFMLNYGDSDEFYDLVESFGYFMEMGHSWSYGFYYELEFEGIKKKAGATYSQKLQDDRWKSKREKVKEKANFICQDCGSQLDLEVHHCYYKYGLEPWQYPIDALRCVCKPCHKERGKIEMVIRARMADLTTNELKSIAEFIRHGMKYYTDDKLIELINKFVVDKSVLIEKITTHNNVHDDHVG